MCCMQMVSTEVLQMVSGIKEQEDGDKKIGVQVLELHKRQFSWVFCGRHSPHYDPVA